MISNISKEKTIGICNVCWQNINCYSQCARKKPTLVCDNTNECWWVTSWRKGHEKSGSWLIRILIGLFIQSDYVRVMLFEVDGCVNHMMERSHSTRLGKCVPSRVCSYSLPGRWILLKLNTHISVPHWDFMQDRLRNPEVPFSDGQWLQSTGVFTKDRMGTSHAQFRRHGNSAFLN